MVIGKLLVSGNFAKVNQAKYLRNSNCSSVSYLSDIRLTGCQKNDLRKLVNMWKVNVPSFRFNLSYTSLGSTSWLRKLWRREFIEEWLLIAASHSPFLSASVMFLIFSFSSFIHAYLTLSIGEWHSPHVPNI
jgi:hypothetical protein